MTTTSRTLLLMMALIVAITLTGCGDSGCPTTSFSSGGSSGGGGVTTGGSVCGSGVNNGGSSAGFVFYFDTAVETASLTTSGSFSTVSTNPPTPPLGGSTDDMETVDSKFLYVPYGSINVVQAFTINSGTGLLTE